MRVFIADNSAVVRQRLINMLSDIEKIEIVGEAQDVPEAINRIGELTPDVVILDIRMPGGSGIDVLKYVKKEHPESIVVMLTNYPYVPYRQKCMDEGADFFFDKSSEFEEIMGVFK